ncbi:substrate-binding domain-containing protein [Verrucomicrobiaceae bacterium 5K15]|uniref:Substrate-binding domain-containing protein n=1 Tax=Oceaniferula flava TaxID=2800421 RepID=A0AAE2SC36_9BACT|nr:substrate-binding domain-containing protein [Oceaniferula flavus]MBK1855049.1 substrate-binding domain-containing protein [Oceaniferula flavus]MBM1136355.1 substrate-binding domain-containing protein [Oceaniferula flavus]
MSEFQVITAAEQVATHLRNELARGAWVGVLPGSNRLAELLGVGHGTIDTALGILEKDGLIVPQGVGRRRRIVSGGKQNTPSLQIKILLYEKSDGSSHYIVDLFHRLHEAGHQAAFTEKSLLDMKMDTSRIKRHVKNTTADAWIVFGGSRSVLEWFAKRPEPVFALAGRRRSVEIAGCGPDKVMAQTAILKKLVGFGHRRIVILSREEHRVPRPGHFEQSFLEQMAAHGLPVGQYNLPNWSNDPGGLQDCLDSLFATTPPTAMFIEEMPIFVAASQHLAQRGISAPRNISMVCGDPNPAFDWCRPTVAHIKWDPRLLVRRIVKWVNNVAQGKQDLSQNSIRSVFVDGGTIGPAPRDS